MDEAGPGAVRGPGAQREGDRRSPHVGRRRFGDGLARGGGVIARQAGKGRARGALGVARWAGPLERRQAPRALAVVRADLQRRHG